MTILSPWRDIDFRKLILSYKSSDKYKYYGGKTLEG